MLALLFFPFIANSAFAPGRSLALYRDRSAPIESRVKDIVSRMTVAEKARQLDMYAGAELVDKRVDNTHAQPGSRLVLTSAEKALGNLGAGSIHDLYPQPNLANEIQRYVIDHNRLGIPALFIEEGLHGYLGLDETIFPASIGLASTWNPKLATETGAGIAAEARACGVHMILGPVLDVAREPRWGRVEEDFGEDPYLTGELAAAYVQGMQGKSLDSDHSVVAEPKHFVGHGSPEGGLNTAPVHAGEREVRTIMLRSFEPAFRVGKAMGVMAAYHEIDGIPCTANSWLLTTVLRGEWGFRGFVLSDLGAINELYSRHHVAETPGDAVRTALEAGVDMQFYDFDHKTFQNAIIDGVKQGTLPLSVLDQAVSRVLRVKFELGLFDHPFVDPALDHRARRSAAHLATALESARQSMCLLKNAANLLPLRKDLSRIAVVGPNGDTLRLGDYATQPAAKPKSILESIRDLCGPGTTVTFDDGKEIAKAVASVAGADVVVMALGEREGISGEGSDRSNLDLPENQEPLLEAISATGIPVVLVLQNGRPLTIPWAAEHVAAILEAWYPGELGGRAIAETLFGDNNPGGRLPVSFPRSVGALPDFYNHDPSKSGSYVDGSTEPTFPFGYGLSYTTFEYSHLRVEYIVDSTNVTVKVDVRNSGARAGDEVVQLYLHPTTSSVETPGRALKGFRRIRLASGQTKTVEFNLGKYEFEVWSASKRWEVEPGDYDVWVGGSSATNDKVRIRVVPYPHPSS